MLHQAVRTDSRATVVALSVAKIGVTPRHCLLVRASSTPRNKRHR